MTHFSFKCPHCNQSLKVPEEMLGRRIKCPSCKGVVDLPSVTPKEPVPPPLPTAAAPPVSAHPSTLRSCPFCGEQILASAIKCKHCGEFLDGRDKPRPKKTGALVEKEVWKGYPSYLSYLGRFILGALALTMGVGLSFTPFGLGSVEILLFIIIPLLTIIILILDRNSRVYTVTTTRVMSESGIISRRVSEVGTRDIRFIDLKQGVLQRLLGLGSVSIGSAGHAAVEVEFAGISNPQGVRDIIRRVKDEADADN